MERWFLIAATLFAAIAGIGGILSLKLQTSRRHTSYYLIAVFLFQLGFLNLRGEMRHACPLQDWGEILVFLAWASTLFYFIGGTPYRVSLLGVFTAPLVVIFQSIALLPSVLSENPQPLRSLNAWKEIHSSVSLLAMGALALAAIASIMYLLVNHFVKGKQLKSTLFRNLPPMYELSQALARLLWIGIILLSLGIVAGFLMPQDGSAGKHLIAALGMWAAYLILILIKQVRGLTGKRLALCTLLLFVSSFVVLALI